MYWRELYARLAAHPFSDAALVLMIAGWLIWRFGRGKLLTYTVVASFISLIAFFVASLVHGFIVQFGN